MPMSSRPEPLLIVHVIHRLAIGGLENGLVNLINRLPHERFRHVVACIEDYTDFAQRIERDDVELVALGRSRIGVWRLRWRLWRLFRRLRPHIVHCRNLSGLDGLLPARLAGAKTVHSEHGFDVSNLRGRATKPALLRRLHAPLVGAYVCVSRDLKRLMIEQWGIAATRITQIYNGVDTARFKPPAANDRQALPSGFAGSDAFIVGTVGRVQAIKDQATLLRAFAAVLKRRPDWRSHLRLMIVGDGPLLEALRQQAQELGVTPACWFTGPRDDVARLMGTMDLFVLPSLNEGISNTLLEAMATGLPLLATAVGGNVELLEEGVVGTTFAPGDVEGLADMIENYAADPAMCRTQGKAARQRAETQFSLQAMVASYQRVYETL
ncbi:TIGR03088 family PEP-CTERM/XrtA system glycosyltransferase [Paucibacter soli]|uniref:TIGR03088 family PEP-CTERM/XrtA system glycosyltransferase n=1 Tax=Paucibacter soli TaxID=3133433 RepID=UPI0030AC2B77